MFDSCPVSKGERISTIGALSTEGLIASMCYEGTLNGDIFLYFLENFLVPQLESGNVVICDNASHKVANVKELIGVNGKGGLSSTIFSRFVADRVVLVEI